MRPKFLILNLGVNLFDASFIFVMLTLPILNTGFDLFAINKGLFTQNFTKIWISLTIDWIKDKQKTYFKMCFKVWFHYYTNFVMNIVLLFSESPKRNKLSNLLLHLFYQCFKNLCCSLDDISGTKCDNLIQHIILLFSVLHVINICCILVLTLFLH